MLSPALPYDSFGVRTFATQGVSSASRVGGLPFSTPEQMYEAQQAGLPRFDIEAMTRAGTLRRANNHGVTSAASIGFHLPSRVVGPSQLITAVKRIDVSRVTAAGIKPCAVFDFDNTLIGGDVFHDFVTLLIQRVDLPNANAERIAKLFVKMAKVDPALLKNAGTNDITARPMTMVTAEKLSLSNAFFMVVGALAGVPEAKATAVAEELFHKGVNGKPPYKTKFFNHGRPDSAEALVKAFASVGVTSHIITLGIPTVARVGAQLIGVPPEHVHGFELEVIDGIITGRAVDARLVGKHIVCERLITPQPLFNFGDSVNSDTPMLSRSMAAGVAVDPDKAFDEHIKKTNADLISLRWKL
jgi:phosphoserine phosphatase